MSLNVEIELDGKVKKIEIKSPLGRHQKQYIRTWSEIAESKELKPELALKFLEMRDNLVVELTEITKEELDELPLTEKEKILEKIEDLILVRRREDFLSSSQKQASS